MRKRSRKAGRAGGRGVSPVAYSPFGEILNAGGSGGGSGGPPGQIPAGFPRYQYAGGWGYESPAGEGFPGAPGGLTLAGVNPNLPPITLMHVGWRWYDPSLGRFVQRDPIGLAGGLNCYAYVGNDPLTRVDLLGLKWEWDWRDFWKNVAGGAAAGWTGGKLLSLYTGTPPPVTGGGAALIGAGAGAAKYTAERVCVFVYDLYIEVVEELTKEPEPEPIVEGPRPRCPGGFPGGDLLY